MCRSVSRHTIFGVSQSLSNISSAVWLEGIVGTTLIDDVIAFVKNYGFHLLTNALRWSIRLYADNAFQPCCKPFMSAGLS